MLVDTADTVVGSFELTSGENCFPCDAFRKRRSSRPPCPPKRNAVGVEEVEEKFEGVVGDLGDRNQSVFELFSGETLFP